jgi:uncharacterized protein (TIGR02118 family)
MLKMIALLKKRAGMSRAEFRDYYESNHAPLILAQQGPNMLEYRRNYLTGEMINGADGSPFDVITEFLYADRAAFDRAFARMMAPEATRVREEDEERLFDIPAIRVFLVESRESDCSATPRPGDGR